MLSGFNTNFRYRGVVFHAQSEDSGRDHPHIITHLYYGGTILVSEKSGYEDRLGEPDLELVVKTLMENQHKAVLKRLVAGDYDHLIRERLGQQVFAEAEARPDEAGAQGLQPDEKDTTGPLPGAIVPGVAPPPRPAAAGPDPRAAATEPESSRAFGEGIVSEKPLDEVILGYLVENARKRKRPQK
jgi:hypothetical protein